MNDARSIALARLGGEISIDALPFINYSIQVNAVKCLRQCVLCNKSDSDWEQILVEIGGEHIEPSRAYIAVLPAGGEVALPELNLRVQGDSLANLSEGLHTTYTISISLGDQLIERTEQPLHLMALDQWTGSDFHPELLTAFVTPNHPVVSSILVEVGQVLEERTGSSAILGYRADSASAVWLQVEVLYEVLRRQGFVYASAPASFEPVGQRIRPIDQVLSEKIGNCMDLSLVFASCLEAMGLNPILVLQHGHIFPGVYLHDTYYENAVCDDLRYLQKGMEQGVHDLLVFEATALSNAQLTKFDDAVELAEQSLRKEEDKFDFAIDIHASRLNGVRPMPRRLVEEGQVRLVNDGLSYRHERSRQRQFELLNMEDAQTEDKPRNPKQLLWERKLLDLSLNNRLLSIRLGSSALQLMTEDIQSLYRELAEGGRFALEGSVEVVQAEDVEWQKKKEEASSTHQMQRSTELSRIIQDELISSLKRKRLHSYADSTEHYRILKELHRGAKVSMEENGANSLYLALGFVRWTEVEGGKVHSAPLILIPVDLKRKNLQSYTLELQDAEASFNITLIEYFYQQTSYRMTGLHPLPMTEEGDIDVELTLARMRAYVRQMKGWEVVEEAVVGNFSFSKFVMWHDIHSHSDVLEAHPITAALMGQTLPTVDETLVPCQFSPSDLERAEEEELLLPLEADSSQIEAVLEAVRGKSFVLHGPPGTGKSQTITNIIANMLGQGKRVLFVAEKMAALEVVQKRMERVGLGDFCLELHGNKVTKKHFLAQMERAINTQGTQSPGHFAQRRREADAERNKILAYTEALHQQRPEGYSLYDLIVRYESIPQPVLELVPSPQLHSGEAMEQLARELRQLESIFRISGEPSKHPLKQLILKHPEASINGEDLRQLLARLEGLIGEAEAFRGELVQSIGLSPNASLESYQLVSKVVDSLLVMPSFGEDYLQLAERPSGVEEAQRACRLMDECLTAREGFVAKYGCLPELKSRELRERYEAVEDKWFLPRYFARKELVKFLAMKGIRIDYEAIPQLITALTSYEDAERAISDSDREQLRGLMPYDGYGRHEDWQKLGGYMEALGVLMQSLLQLSACEGKPYLELRKSLSEKTNQVWHIQLQSQGLRLKVYCEHVRRLEESVEEVSGLLHLDKEQSLSTLQNQLQLWQQNLPELRNWTQWLVRRQALVQMGAADVVRHIEAGTDIATLPERTERALYGQIAEEIINTDSRLSMFKGLIFEEAIKLYRQLSAELHNLSRQELYQRVAERIPNGTNMASLSLNISQELAQLKRFIASGGRAKSIRSMLDAIPNLLPILAPCMLMSPLSVAQYIAMDAEKFDLVIFDEASQMPTSDAVGTIARGKALVVVGDPKQMPPTSFFVSQQVAEEEADIDDMESILDDCIALSIPSRYLAWHYRSRHESLIAFSNNCFYEGRLYTFPSVDNQTSKLRLVKVEGTYARSGSRNNVAEAEAVVNELIRRVQDPQERTKSIGIVAFSQTQQELIEDKLYARTQKDAELDKLLAELPEPLFIKNLENVQGDERDVILFSVGYGPDAEGKVSMNFGPLNNKGGERRLNVAASRSRLEMMIFTSITAEQIDLRRTESEGVASLKLLLECAALGTSRLSSRAEQLRLPSSIVNEVAAALRGAGYAVDLMVGTSSFRVDIAVHHPTKSGTYLAGIVFDGEGYYRTRTVRDRECVQQSVLKGLGWQILRLWTLDWYTEPKRTLEGLLSALKDLVV